MLKDLSSITIAWAGILLSTIPGQMVLYLTLAGLIVGLAFGVIGWPGEVDPQYTIELDSKVTNIIFTVEESKR